jgi:asparagine synthase (glutamine-hydrolysing)
MCGIAGIAGRPDAGLVERMTRTLAHRGPDDEGFYNDSHVSLGHRRLSIIDLGTGHQPMNSADGALWIVFNGEIYNFLELRRELEAQGQTFRTRSDTEVILAAYAVWGEDCVARLQGMFAFALWDTRTRAMLLARDQAGVKPLYYARAGEALYFGSEIKALLPVPGISRSMDYAALDDYLTYLYTVPPRTMFRDIRQLPPGTLAVWREGAWTERRYWRLELRQEQRSEQDWAEAVSACLDEVIGKNMIADVPLGAFLSGGLDSATIVHHMLQQTNAAVNTFTIGFGPEGRRYDETAPAREMARYFGTVHRELTAETDAARLLPVIVRHFDEPFGNPTALLTYAICELVRKHVTVVLSGDGGDENFGGYPRYAGAAMAERYQRIPALLRRWIINPLVQRLPESTGGFHALRRLREFSAGSLLDPVSMYAAWISYFSPEQRQSLYTPDTQRAVGDHDALAFLHGLAREAGTDDPVARAMYIDLHSFLPNNVLQYGDRMSMAHALETRVPLADVRLIELLARIPSRLKIDGFHTKRLLRRCMAGRLPANVLRRKKAGFNPPMGVWLNTRLRPLVETYLSPEQLRRDGFFRPEPIQQMISEHRAGRRDYTWHLWSLLVFEEWRRQYLG